MASKRQKKIPLSDHVVRYVSWSRLRKNANDEVIGVLGEAFKMRDTETSLSTTWPEYFQGSHKDQIIAAVRAIRGSKLGVKPKSGFAIGVVGTIQAECAERDYSVRILHEPKDDNEAHAAVRSLPREDMELLESLATGAWAEWILNKNVGS
jgi:hypothetical protein